MKRATIGLAIGFWLLSGAAAAADEVGVAVMEFASKGGVSQEQMDALSDLVATEIRGLGGYRVVGKGDIRAALNLEQQKQLLGCTEEGCAAELGGMLGVRWVLLGNVSKFGKAYLLNLKVMDAEKMRIADSVSKKLEGGEEDLIDELAGETRKMFTALRPTVASAPRPAPVEPPVTVQQEPSTPMRPLTKWGHVAFWSGLGLAAFGGVAIWQAEEAADRYAQDGSSRDAHRAWNGVAYTAFGLGGALLVTGAVLWLWPDGPAAQVSLVPAAGSDGGSLTIVGRW